MQYQLSTTKMTNKPAKAKFSPHATVLAILLIAALALAGCDGLEPDPVVVETATETVADADDAEVVDDDEIVEDEEVVDEEVVDDEVGDEAEATVAPADATAAGSGVGVQGVDAGTYARGYALMDWDFENIDGGVSGEIEDFYFDMNTGRIPFVDIEYGGVLELGDTEIVVPLNAFNWGTGDELTLNFDETALENFPDLGDDWPDVNLPGWDDDVNNFWGDLGYEVAPETTGDASGPIVKASELRGFALVDLGELGAGTIQDFLVDIGEARVRYVMVNYGAGAAGINDAFILPLEVFNFEGTTDGLGEELVFDAEITEEMLITAPRFDPVLFGEGDVYGPGWNATVDEYWQQYLPEQGEE